jgi:hypothetical protein
MKFGFEFLYWSTRNALAGAHFVEPGTGLHEPLSHPYIFYIIFSNKSHKTIDQIFNFSCGENDSYPSKRSYHMYLTWSVIEFVGDAI